MSHVRASVLEGFRTLCNHSGCHQLPERSFRVRGRQFPLCARCTGVLIGQGVALVSLLGGFLPSCSAGMALLGVMGADWSLQKTGICMSTNRRRFLTGIMGGLGWICILVSLICTLLAQTGRIISDKKASGFRSSR